jgi:hypothetical protein
VEDDEGPGTSPRHSRRPPLTRSQRGVAYDDRLFRELVELIAEVLNGGLCATKGRHMVWARIFVGDHRPDLLATEAPEEPEAEADDEDDGEYDQLDNESTAASYGKRKARAIVVSSGDEGVQTRGAKKRKTAATTSAPATPSKSTSATSKIAKLREELAASKRTSSERDTFVREVLPRLAGLHAFPSIFPSLGKYYVVSTVAGHSSRRY